MQVEAKCITRISVIIPALNEECYLADCLKSLMQCQCEVIVVDGGSTDNTVAIAEDCGAKVICPGIANRAIQMNAGAAEAQGELFLFFHADSRLPSGGIESMIAAMRDPRVVGGCFALGFFPSAPFHTFLATAANIFCRITRMMFGDRGMFIRASDFELIGKFPETAVMEDADLGNSMRRLGRTVFLSDVVMTSARKYADETIPQSLYRTVWALVAYRLGVPAEKIKAGYYGLNKLR